MYVNIKHQCTKKENINDHLNSWKHKHTKSKQVISII